MTSFGKLTGLTGGAKKSPSTDPLKTRIPGSAIGFKKEISKKRISKIINVARVEVNGRKTIMRSDKLRDELIGLVKKAGTKGLSGKQLEKKLRENYKMNIKDRKRVMRGIAKHWAKPEGGLTAKRREKIKRLNVAMYGIERDKEHGVANSSGNKINNKSVISDILRTKEGSKITGERLGIEAVGSKSEVSALGGIPKSGVADGYNKSGFANSNEKTAPITGGFGTKPSNLGNLGGGRGTKPLGL